MGFPILPDHLFRMFFHGLLFPNVSTIFLGCGFVLSVFIALETEMFKNVKLVHHKLY